MHVNKKLQRGNGNNQKKIANICYTVGLNIMMQSRFAFQYSKIILLINANNVNCTCDVNKSTFPTLDLNFLLKQKVIHSQ